LVRSAPQVGFTALYVAEVVVKVVGLGHAAFWADQQNMLAALCTTASLIDTGLYVSGGGGGCVGGGGGADALLRLFRALRLLRLLRLANRVPGLEVGSPQRDGIVVKRLKRLRRSDCLAHRAAGPRSSSRRPRRPRCRSSCASRS